MKFNWNTNPGLKLHIGWPTVFAGVMLLVSLVLLWVDVLSGCILLIFSVAFGVCLYVWYSWYGGSAVKQMVAFGSSYAQLQKQLLYELDIPYAMIDEQGSILWLNKAFKVLTDREKTRRRRLGVLFPDLDMHQVCNNSQYITTVSYQDKKFCMKIRQVYLQDMPEMLEENFHVEPQVDLFAVYLYDETELISYQNQVIEEQAVVGLLYLDNYEEVLDSVEEVRRSLTSALLDRRINKYIHTYEGLIKKLEKDKYLILINQKNLRLMQEKRFTLLEEIKNVNIGPEMVVTVSIGFGTQGDTYEQNFEYAKTAIDMALGRGGDQVVLKAGENISYYGGKAQAQEKSTRVKARVKAHALKSIIENKDKVLIMGHSISDVDCLGAAVGVYRAAKTSGKRSYIVLNTVTKSVEPLLQRFQVFGEYEKDMFIQNEAALELIDEQTLLVIVDVNRPSYTECPKLIEKATHIVVLDHHRQTREVIGNAVLSYVEPYASSASEMVAEILQYYSENVRLRSVEADAMYAGIVVDTNNFQNKTGVRTFEAAAYLRSCGADMTRVRKMFREGMMDVQTRAEAVSSAEIYADYYAISICSGMTEETPTVIGAQAANELLNVQDIKASFVFTEYNHTIYISARSIDEVNVQVIMERLGGGGHLSIAGAQLKDVTLEEAIDQLKQVLDDMMENQEI